MAQTRVRRIWEMRAGNRIRSTIESSNTIASRRRGHSVGPTGGTLVLVSRPGLAAWTALGAASCWSPRRQEPSETTYHADLRFSKETPVKTGKLYPGLIGERMSLADTAATTVSCSD
jgi:hypothetical protein